MGVVIKLVLLIFVVVPLAITWSGYVFSKLWLWFIVPAFGLPALSIPYALGIALIVVYLTYHGGADTDKSNTEAMLGAFLKPLFALALGWIYYQFI